MNRYYHYSNLSDKQKLIYKKICYGLCKLQLRLEFEYDEDYMSIMQAVEQDNPELFYVKFTKAKIFKYKNQLIYKPDYFVHPQLIPKIRREINEYIETNFKALESPLETIRQIYNKFIEDFDYWAYAALHFETTKVSNTMLGPYEYSKGTSLGLAKAFQYAMRKFGFETTILRDEAKIGVEPYHYWNLVQYGGDFYYCDLMAEFDEIEINKDGHKYFMTSTLPQKYIMNYEKFKQRRYLL